MKRTTELYLAMHPAYWKPTLIADFHLSLAVNKPQKLGTLYSIFRAEAEVIGFALSLTELSQP